MFDFSLVCTVLVSAASGIVAWTAPFDTTILGVACSSSQQLLSFNPTDTYPSGVAAVAVDFPFAAPLAGIYQCALTVTQGKVLYALGKASSQTAIWYLPIQSTGA
jgi:hypothetical protein